MPTEEAIVVYDLVWIPFADAFMEVGVFVAVLIAGFGWLRWRHGDRLLALGRRRRWAPLLGAVLGVSPGCAGAILMMPLYVRGSVSFGGVIAALVATMGDSSWVIMAADPSAALLIHAILFTAGVVTGYAVDALRLSPPARTGPSGAEVSSDGPPDPIPRRGRRPSRSEALGRAGTGSSTPVMVRYDTPAPAGAAAATLCRTTEPLVVASFWVLAGLGIVVAVPTAFQLVDAAALTAMIAGLDPYLTLGVAGTLIALAVSFSGRMLPGDDTVATARSTASDQPFSAVLRHGAREASFVISWVAIIYVAWAVFAAWTGFDGSELPLFGVLGVVVGAAIGLIPGCAVQIVFTGLYISGAVPFATLMANAVSQDGDALLPLLASETRAALMATCITTVPGLLVGGLCLMIT